MKSGWSTFACIALLAATAGFVAGYAATLGRAPLAGNPQWSATPSVPGTPAILEFPGSESPILLDPEFDSELMYFPEAILADAEALAPEPRDTPAEISIDSAPGILPGPSSTATPLPAVAEHGSGLQRLIDSEFSDLSAQQREVWLDVLEGLPLEDAAGILRLWKQFGRGPAGTEIPDLLGADLGGSEPQPIEIQSADVRTVPQIHPTLATIRQIRELVVHNLLNAETHGFRRYESLLTDTLATSEPTTAVTNELTSADATAQNATGVSVQGWRINQEQGEIQPTGNSLDVAITGRGFFIVQEDDQTFYTRCGRFHTDEDGRLALDHGEFHVVLQPEVTVPADADEIFIDSDGIVQAVRYGEEPESIGTIDLATFRDPARLRPIGGTLFEATEASGSANRRTPHSAETGWLQQRALESSNVVLDEELAQLEWLDLLAREIDRSR